MPPQPPPARPADPPYPACVPIMSDGVVRLRAHRPEDAPRIVEQCQNAASQAFLPLPSPYHLGDARDFLDKVADGWGEEWGAREWAITDESDLFLGSANLHDRSPFRAEVGFGLHPDARGRGLASAAVRLLADRAFAEGALALRWRALAGNWASRRVAWDCGFDAPSTVSAAGLDGGGHPIDEWQAVLRPGSPLRPRTPGITAAVEGARVSLRDFRDDDVQWLPWDVDAQAPGFVDREMPTRDGYREWLAEQRSRACQGESLQWAVADRRTNELLGAIVLSQLSEPRTAGRGLLGFWLLQRWRGRDLMTEAVELAIDSAFASATSGQRLPIRALKAYVHIDDEASARVVRAVGFTQCGRERAAYDHGDSAPSDALVFEVLATDDRGARRLRPLVPPVIETERLRMRPWRDSDRPGPEDGPDEAAVRWMPAGAQPGP
ncbi:MAG: GNAT family N-acetyltransferase, partial [Candidatus Phosphoribacter sp.]